MFGRESTQLQKLRIELADQRKINARMRSNSVKPARTRILDQALRDATKLIDLNNDNEPTTRQAVAGLISRRRYDYAISLLKSGRIVHGGGRGGAYRWRRMPYEQMIAAAKGTRERMNDNSFVAIEHLPTYIKNRVEALSPPAH